MFKELEVTSTGVALTFLGLTILTIGLILFFRRKYNSYRLEDLVNNNAKDVKSASLSQRTKFPEMDVFKNSGSFFNYGMVVAVALSLVAMSWTTYERVFKIDLNDLVLEDELEVDIPRTAEPPPPPPPPPPPVIQEVPDTEVIEDQPEFLDQTIEEETVVEAPKEVKKAPPPPPPPPPPAPEEEEVFRIVEENARFPGCEDKGTIKEKEECAKGKMLEYIYKNLKYPAIARENGVEGQVVLQFVVDKTGKIGDIKIVRDIGAGCGTAAEAVVASMNNMGQKWSPGKQRGRPVKVLFTLPVKFKLEG